MARLSQPRCKVSVNPLFLAIEGCRWRADEGQARELPSSGKQEHNPGTDGCGVRRSKEDRRTDVLSF